MVRQGSVKYNRDQKMRNPHYLSCTGETWDKARMRTLVRDDFRCQAHKLGLCDEPCEEDRVRHLQVHHIKQRIHGGTHDLDNLLTVCKPHHIDIHPHMRLELRAKPKELGKDSAWFREL